MLSSIVLVILFIGVLITFHEFGHLIVAKLARIPVQTFSVGFGPALLKKKWGGTEYRLAVVPLGGYIKMLGEEDNAEGGFNTRGFWVRAAVIAAGPVFNLILGFVMLVVMYLAFGIGFTAPIVNPGPDSQAALAGLRTGDVVVRVDDDTVLSFERLEAAFQAAAGRTVRLRLARAGEPLSVDYQVPLEYSSGEYDPVIGRVRAGGPADSAGLKPGDRILSVAGKSVKTWTDFSTAIRGQDSTRFLVEWSRAGEPMSESLVVAREDDPEIGLKKGEIGVEVDLGWYLDPLVRPVVGNVRRRGPADRIGLLTGDTIVSIGGTPVSSWDEYTGIVHRRGGQPTPIEWRRNGVLYSDTIVPGIEPDQLTGEKVGQIGVTVLTPRRHLPPLRVVLKAMERSGYVVVQTFVIIYSVVTRRMTARAIGGPIMVAKIAYEGASWGAEYFLALWSLLSINLFVVNMLPIPVLDGGRVGLFLFESVRRRRLSEKELGWAMNVGWLLIGLVVAFTLFNDVLRLIRR